MSKPRKPFAQMSFLDPATSAPAALPPDVQAGKTWWNSLKPRERKERLDALRLRGVLSASVADAWADEKRRRG